MNLCLDWLMIFFFFLNFCIISNTVWSWETEVKWASGALIRAADWTFTVAFYYRRNVCVRPPPNWNVKITNMVGFGFLDRGLCEVTTFRWGPEAGTHDGICVLKRRWRETRAASLSASGGTVQRGLSAGQKEVLFRKRICRQILDRIRKGDEHGVLCKGELEGNGRRGKLSKSLILMLIS